MWKRRGLLLLLFFASGSSGLVYELVWIRQFGTLFGSSIYSAAIVTAIYMGGLGLGAWLVGAWSDQRFRADPVSPLRWYAGFELLVGGLAAFAMLIVPLLAPVAAAVSSYQMGDHGWFWLAPAGSIARYGIAAVLLLPITLLMGGTLTLLIRYLVSDDLSSAGWQVGLLYGVNTAGAAMGCLLTDTALVPLLGIRSTQTIAVGMNLFAAAGAWWLSRQAAAPRPQISRAGPEVQAGDARVASVALALAFTGFASMAMQIVWFRQLISMFAAFRPVFSITLTVILVGIWLGSLLGGGLARRWQAAPLYALALAGFALFAFAGLFVVQHGEATFRLLPSEEVDPLWRWPTLYWRLLKQISWVVGPASLFAGAAYPLANAMAQRSREHVGMRAGLLYLASTFGGVLGSLVAGFALLPHLGIQSTVTVVMVCVLAALAALWGATGWQRLPAAGRSLEATAAALVLLALLAWGSLPDQFLLRRSLPLALGSAGRGVLALHEGVNETLAIVQQRGPMLRLLTNGYSLAGTSIPGLRYMRAFVHVPMLLGDDIETILVMCFGVGNTVNAALLYPGVRKVDVVELSPDVLAHSKYFEMVNGRPLDDPRTRVYVNDARHHLLMVEEETYDLVTGEPPPPTHVGVVNLYTREFFELVRSRLRPGGWVTYWLPLHTVGDSVARKMVRAFLDVFPQAVLLSGYRQELILVGRKQAPIEIHPDAVKRRMAAVPGLRSELRGIALDSAVELVGMLAATTPTLERATRGVEPLRDDHPILEYAIRELQSDPWIPSDLVSVADLDLWCPRCWSDALDREEQQRLRGYLEVISHYYRSQAFLRSRPEPALGHEVQLSENATRAVAHSFYLQDLLGQLPPLYRRALLLERHGQPRFAIASLKNLLRANPEHLRAQEDLAELQLRFGQHE